MAGWTDYTDKGANWLAAALAAVFAIGLLAEDADKRADVGLVLLHLFVLVPMLWFGMMMAFKILLFPAVGLIVALYRAARRGVRQMRVASRLAALDEGAATVRDALGAAGLPAALPHAEALTGLSWASAARGRRFRPVELFFAIVSPLLLTGFTGYRLWGPEGAFWLAITVGCVLAALAATSLRAPDLAADLFKAAAAAAGHPGTALQPVEHRRRGRLPLPSGATAVFTLDPYEATATFDLSVCAAAPLPWDVTLVAHDRLDDERGDVDTGDDTFDRATLLVRRADASRYDLVTAWLSAPLRATLARLLSLGATQAGPELRATFDVRAPDAPARLAELLALFDAWHALVIRAAADAPFARAVASLRAAATDAERRALLAEARDHTTDADRARLGTTWAREGTGRTRVDAALLLPDSSARDRALDALVDVRERNDDALEAPCAAAVAALAALAPSLAAAALRRTVEAADPDLLLAGARSAPHRFGPALSAALERGLGERAVPAPVAGPLALLAVASGAPAPAPTLLRWLEAALAAPHGANLVALAALAHHPALPPGLDRARLAEALARQAGGLSLAAEAQAGQLSLATAETPKAPSAAGTPS